jgi:hypothetical protein
MIELTEEGIVDADFFSSLPLFFAKMMRFKTDDSAEGIRVN